MRRVSGKTKFQKLAFLLQREGKTQAFAAAFTFEAYYYGPYSDELNQTLAQLVGEGLINPNPYVFVTEGKSQLTSSFFLSDTGNEEVRQILIRLPKEVVWSIQSFIEPLRFEPLSRILEYVYRIYPEMAKNANGR